MVTERPTSMVGVVESWPVEDIELIEKKIVLLPSATFADHASDSFV
jgi:hypothetical protein